jgi:predicted ester cyclase
VSDASLKELYRRWILDLWNGDLAAANDIVSDDFLVHQARTGPGSSEDFRGPDGLRQMIRDGHAPFSEIAFEIEVGPIVEGNMVAGRWKATGTYAGGIPGATAPAGTRVTWGGSDILRAENGTFVEYWISADVFQLMTQLGG